MRGSFAKKKISIDKICKSFDISRQAHYKSVKVQDLRGQRDSLLVEMVIEKRTELKREGYHKLYRRMKLDIERSGLNVGRDNLLKVLRNNDLLVKPKKRKYVSTTDSKHPFKIYKNEIQEKQLSRKNEVWVSDITYIRINNKFMYLALITDLFSRKIVGFDFSNSLELEGCVRALKMPLKGRKDAKNELIHHSDRGCQYCSYVYTGILKRNRVKISMAAAGNCYENATAERINGILKGEFNLDQTFCSVKLARKAIKQAIDKYNNLRLHMSIGYQTPSQVHAA